MDHLYAFYDSENNEETFHIQCEWLNKTINLDDPCDDQEIEYAFITITDLTSYWQCKITHGILLERFKVSNALSKDKRNDVLMAAFLGQSSVNESKLEWRVAYADEDKLQMKLRTFDGDLAFAAGFILLNKVPHDKSKELLKSWLRNSALASQRSTEINKSLQQRINDIEKTNTELKETIETMTVESVKKKLVLIDKFVGLLNEKKRKIFMLQTELKKSPKERVEEKDTKKRKIKEEAPKPKEEVIKNEEIAMLSSSLPIDDDDDDDDYFIDTIQTVR